MSEPSIKDQVSFAVRQKINFLSGDCVASAMLPDNDLEAIKIKGQCRSLQAEPKNQATRQPGDM